MDWMNKNEPELGGFGMGHIVIDESMTDWIYGGKPNAFIVFMYFLRKSDENGVVQVSVERISKDVKLTPRQVRSAIECLKNDKILTKEMSKDGISKGTIFTVLDKDTYFSNVKRTTKERQKKTVQEPQQKKQTKQIEPTVYYPNDEKLNQAFLDFIEHRKQIKKPMTDLAISRNMKELEKLSSNNGVMDNDKAIAIIDQSIAAGWQGLFPLKENYKSREERGHIDWDSI